MGSNKMMDKISWKPLLIGTGIAIGVFLATRFLFAPIWEPTVRLVLVFVGVPLGALFGGYYAARECSIYPYLHGIAVPVLQIGLLTIFRSLPVWPVLWAGTLIAAAFGAYWSTRMPYQISSSAWGGGRSTTVQSNRVQWRWRNPFAHWMSNLRAESLYQSLLRRVRKDEGIADRLIDLERRRNPYANRETLVRNALERLDRDNR